MSSNWLTPKAPSLRGQARICMLLSGLGVAITLLFHSGPAFQQWHSGQALASQLAVVALTAVVAFGSAFIALRLPFIVRRTKLPSALGAIDLSGNKPLLFGLAAGVGEECLFRAALLPLLGLWVSSALFALAHLRTAQLAKTRVQRVAYVASTFVAGVALGFVFIHIGLLAAIGVHAIIDIVGLWAAHRLKALHGAAAAT